MKLYDNLWVYKNRRSGTIYTNALSADGRHVISSKSCDAITKRHLNDIYRLSMKRSYTEQEKCNTLKRWIEVWTESNTSDSVEKSITDAETVKTIDKSELIQKLMNFFSEFSFSTNFRFINTFAYAVANDQAVEYVQNYFNLTDNEYKNAITDKMKSSEFVSLLYDFKQLSVTSKINDRFKLYYGTQGTGKTTLAMKEASACMVCHSAMLPSDLMEDFNFEDGKAAFNPSSLYKAMEEGTVIVLDEINLLPFESLRFLQSLLDGKASFNYKGREVHIRDGFKIIGTMNLQVNGVTYALPEPLVDRAEELREFVLTANDLVEALN